MRIITASTICLGAMMCGACLPPYFGIGGGSSNHSPPDRAVEGEPLTLELELRVWGDGSGAMSKRWSAVNCVYRTAVSEYTTIPMTSTIEEEKRIVFACTIPPQDMDAEFIEYRFEMVFDGRYGPREGGRIDIESAESGTVVDEQP